MAGDGPGEVNEIHEIIGAAIAEVGAERPSPDFTARLRLEIERLPQRAPAWRVPAVAATTVVAAAIAVAVALDGARRFDRPANTTQRDIALAAEQATTTVERPAAARTSPPRVTRAKTSPGGAASVLVPRRERQAVDRLFASLRAGRPDVVSALGRLGAGGVDDVAESIAPIRIEPVAVPVIPAAAPLFDR
jgi:hypothetical protein